MTSQADVVKSSTDVIGSFDSLGGSNWRELSCCEHAVHQHCGVDSHGNEGPHNKRTLSFKVSRNASARTQILEN